MSVLFAEKIEAIADVNFESPRLPPQIAKLFAKAGVLVPSVGTIALDQVDTALKGLGIEQRMTIKSELATLGMID